MHAVSKQRVFNLLPLLVLTAALVACGYTIRHSYPVDTVRLGPLRNNTTEPKLEDRLYEAMTHELMRNGVQVDNGSEYAIEGTLDSIELKGTAEKDDITIQYEVRINGSFVLKGPGGESRNLRKSGAFIVSFTSEGALAEVIALKEQAIARALADMSEEIVASLIQQQ